MPLAIGARFGPYEIVSLIGAGGMGEVYRASDTTLNRDVALKILPETFAHDQDRVARFKREAQVLASLNHPHVAAIHGLAEAEGYQILVLELVDGEDLAQRIARGAIPLDDVLPIARQIADALEAAHEQGIVHRDLKPANIKVRPDGTVKVLDFGLAKALELGSGGAPSATMSPTITTPAMTQMGMILGTAAYMSPEQAKGRAADKRSDIWAFGCVLYEMLSGERAFKGEDVSDTLAAVLRQELDWTAVPEATPAALRRLIARCLDRDPKRRLRDIGEARIVLDDPAARDTSAERSSTTALPIASTRPLWRRSIPIVLNAIAAAVLAGTVAWMWRPVAPLAVTRFSFTLPEGQTLTATGRHILAISPDGAQLVYVALPGRLYRRSLSELDAKPIQGLDGVLAATSSVFSPDGRSVAFFATSDSTLKKIAVTGGTAVTLCPADNPFGISWEDDSIVFGQGRKGVMRVPANGGAPEVLVSAKDGEVMQSPQILPGGRDVLFTVASAGGGADQWDKANVVVQSLSTGERRTLVQGGSDARYIPTGHLVYAISGTVFAVPFDTRRLEVRGGPVPVVEGVRRASGSPPATAAAQFSVSRTGSLVYFPGPVSTSTNQLEIILADGAAVSRLKLPPGSYSSPRVSPDGKRIAFGTDDGKDAAVWIYDLSGATAMRRLTFAGHNRFPVWSADGKHVVFQSDRDGDLGIFWTPADGGNGERLTRADQGTSHVPESWSPTGGHFVYSNSTERDYSLWTFSMQTRKATPFDAVHSSNPTGAVFSPDGRWVAYTITEQGRTTVAVQPFPPTGTKYQLFSGPNDGPHHAVWSPNGNALFYNPRAGGFESVSVTTQPTFAVGNPVPVPRPFSTGGPSVRRPFDITPEGKFVGLANPSLTDSSAETIQVVLNWQEELKQRVPTR